MNTAIIGHGRFGALLGNILSSQYTVTMFDKGDSLEPLNQFDSIFLCVPIRSFETVIKAINTHLKPGVTIIDTCSVKLHPVKCMLEHLAEHTHIIATHPLFGPDSYSEAGPCRMMMEPTRCDNQIYKQWKNFFESQSIHILEMSAEAHDRFAACSQGITHVLGRTLESMGICQTPIDTLGFTRLLGIVNQTCNDTRELFEDLQKYNPYFKPVLEQLMQTLNAQLKTFE